MDLVSLYHDVFKEIFLSDLEHSHWWFHIVMHASMTFVPLSLLGMSLLYAYKVFSNHQINRPKYSPIAATVKQNKGPLPFGFVGYFFQHTKLGQLRIVALVLVSLPVYYGTLELPKLIVNNAILADGFPYVFFNMNLSQIEFLMSLSSLYLLLIIANGAIKFMVNTSKGALGEKIIRRLRITLFKTFRHPSKKKLSTAQLIPMIGQEVEPIGGFASELITVPVLQGGTLLTIFAFFLLQNPILAFAAISMLPIQLYVIPKLQKKVNILARERVIEIRSLSQKISDSELATPQQHTMIFRSIKTIQNIRVELFRRKYFLKALNNFLISLTPFFFYSIGGLLVIEDRITIGTLIASIAAYKDLSSPIKELLSYYQNYENVRIRYNDMRVLMIV